MASLQTILSLTFFGPRKAADSNPPRWRFCLRVSACYDQEPGTSNNDTLQDWAQALLPWNLFGLASAGAGTPTSLQLRPITFSPNDNPLRPRCDHGTLEVAGGSDGRWLDFHRSHRAEIHQHLIQLAGSPEVRFAWGPPSAPASGSDPTEPQDRLPLSMLLATLGSLPPPLATGLQAAFYFELPAASVRTIRDDPGERPLLIFAPEFFRDSRRDGGGVWLRRTCTVSVLPSGDFRLEYESEDKSRKGFAIFKPLAWAEFHQPKVKALEYYWLPVEDVRSQSYAEIDQHIAKGLEGANRLSAVSVPELAARLVVNPSKENPDPDCATPLEVAQRLVERARQDRELMPPAADTSNEEAQKAEVARRERIRKFLANLKPRSNESLTTPVERLRRALKDDVVDWWKFHWHSTGPQSGSWQARALDLLQRDGLLPGVSELKLAKGAEELAEAFVDLVLPPERGTKTRFGSGDITDLPVLTSRLRQPQASDAMACAVCACLSQDTRQRLEEWDSGGADDCERRALLVSELNRLLVSGSPDATALEAVAARLPRCAEAVELLKQSRPPTGPRRAELRRRLLEETFSEALASPPSPSPTPPNEALELLIGEAGQRLVHRDDPAMANAEELAQMGAVGLLVRRAATAAAFDQDSPPPWQLVTAAVGVLDPQDHLASRPFGIDSAGSLTSTPEALAAGWPLDFLSGVLRSEIGYRGEPLKAASPLDFVHRQRGPREEVDPYRLSSLSYQAAGSQPDLPHRSCTLCPPLRYGDFYQFAAFVVDRASGMPDELLDAEPGTAGPSGFVPEFRWAQLTTLKPKVLPYTLQFTRRVSIGDLNLLPGSAARQERSQPPAWPAVPAGVHLRALEWLEHRLGRPEETPALLLGHSDPNITIGELAPQQEFRVALPCLDEFTFTRWWLPAPGEPEDRRAGRVQELATARKRIYRDRDVLMAGYALFRPEEIPHQTLPKLVGRFVPDPQDPVSRHLYDVWFSAATKQRLSEYVNHAPGPKPTPEAVVSALVADLNRVVTQSSNSPEDSLWHAERFARLTLSRETETLLRQGPTSGPALKRLNRMLLEDAYATGNELLLGRSALNRAACDPETARVAAKDLLPHEPAVSAIGVRLVTVSHLGTQETEEQLVQVVRVSLFNALPLHVTAESVASEPSCRLSHEPGRFPDTAPQLTVSIPAGWFGCLEFFPLVSEADFARFDFEAVRHLLEPPETHPAWQDQTGRPYRAFRPSRVLVESVSDILPDAHELYGGFELEADGSGAVRCHLRGRNGAPPANLVFVDYFTLLRQRWVWRNRPLLSAMGLDPRQLAGGLPKALFDPGVRDSSPDVFELDTLASIDRGFVDRSPIERGDLPRKPGGEPLADMLLTVDDRDGVGAGDYLRYGLVVHSRYAPVLKDPAKRQRRATREGQDLVGCPDPAWRRIVMPYRGQPVVAADRDVGPPSDGPRLKPLKVLAILPLTREPRQALPGRAAASPRANPLLAVLDEVWYREYGPGETLEAYVSIEQRETVGQDAEHLPHRLGPLPDHHTEPRGKAFEDTDTTEAPPEPRLPLRVFGPFGYTLDRTDNEALANATAFVLYPPDGVDAHWWLGIRLRRALTHFAPSETPVTRKALEELTLRSAPSDVHHLYTLPGDLATQQNEEEGRLRLGRNPDPGSSQGGGPVGLSNLELHLYPVRNPHEQVRAQYHYLLLLGRLVTDAAGGFEVFLPEQACWLDPFPSLRWRTLGNGQVPADLKDLKWGRIIELRQSGLSPQSNEWSQAINLRELLRNLFPDSSPHPADAPAAIRRISDLFGVEVE